MTNDTDTTAARSVRLQYWPASRSADGPGGWPEAYTFDTVDDAVAFAMTQSPANREIAWLSTGTGEVLKEEQIRRRWALRPH